MLFLQKGDSPLFSHLRTYSLLLLFLLSGCSFSMKETPNIQTYTDNEHLDVDTLLQQSIETHNHQKVFGFKSKQIDTLSHLLQTDTYSTVNTTVTEGTSQYVSNQGAWYSEFKHIKDWDPSVSDSQSEDFSIWKTDTSAFVLNNGDWSEESPRLSTFQDTSIIHFAPVDHLEVFKTFIDHVIFEQQEDMYVLSVKADETQQQAVADTFILPDDMANQQSDREKEASYQFSQLHYMLFINESSLLVEQVYIFCELTAPTTKGIETISKEYTLLKLDTPPQLDTRSP